MELTLWRHFTQLNINNGDILVCKKVRVNDFGGKNLTTTSDSKLFINPSISNFQDISKEILALKNFSEQNELNKGIIDISDNIDNNNSNDNMTLNKIKNDSNDNSNKNPNNNYSLNSKHTIIFQLLIFFFFVFLFFTKKSPDLTVSQEVFQK